MLRYVQHPYLIKSLLSEDLVSERLVSYVDNIFYRKGLGVIRSRCLQDKSILLYFAGCWYNDDLTVED